MLTPYAPKLVCTGRQWWPVWAAVRGGVGVACYTGGRQYWPTPWPSAVVAAVRVAGWCAGWRSLPLVSVRRAGGRSVASVRPWPWWPFSWPLAAFWPSAGPLVRRGPFVARGGPFGPCVLALSVGSVPPPLVARRRWCAVLVLACLVCAVGGRGGRVAGRPCWCRWCRCHCGVPWSVVRVAGRQCWPPCWRCCWWCHCAVPYWAVCRGRPSVLVSAVAVAGRVRPSLLVCWCAVGGWRSFLAVFRGRGGPFGPSVVLVSVAGPCGPCGPCFGPCRLAGRVGLASGWRRWLAVLALAVVLAYFKERRPVAGWRWAVCGTFVVVVSACLVCGPCWCRASGGRGPSVYQRTKHQRPPWRPCWWCVLLVRAGVGGAGVGGHVLAPVGPRTAAVGRRAVGVTY